MTALFKLTLRKTNKQILKDSSGYINFWLIHCRSRVKHESTSGRRDNNFQFSGSLFNRVITDFESEMFTFNMIRLLSATCLNNKMVIASIRTNNYFTGTDTLSFTIETLLRYRV